MLTWARALDSECFQSLCEALFFFFLENPLRLWFTRITVDKDEIRTAGSKDDAIVDALISLLCERLLLCSVGSSGVCYWYRMTQTSYSTLKRELWSSRALTQTPWGAPRSLTNCEASQSSSEPCESRWCLQREDCLNQGFRAESAGRNTTETTWLVCQGSDGVLRSENHDLSWLSHADVDKPGCK